MREFEGSSNDFPSRIGNSGVGIDKLEAALMRQWH